MVWYKYIHVLTSFKSECAETDFLSKFDLICAVLFICEIIMLNERGRGVQWEGEHLFPPMWINRIT